MSRRPPPDRIDIFANAIRSALDDVHGKLIDQAWFGRQGTNTDRHLDYADMRAFYGRASDAPENTPWYDRLKSETPSPTHDKDPEIER